MTDETTPLFDIQSKPLRTFFHVNNSCPISFPLSDADRYLLRCGNRTDMMFQAERIEQGETNNYIKFGTISKHNYILYLGSKDVDLQIVSLPYTILFDLMCWLSCLFRSTFIRQLFSSLNVSGFLNYISFQFLCGCILKYASTKVLADSTCGRNKQAGTGSTAKCIATAWKSLRSPCLKCRLTAFALGK